MRKLNFLAIMLSLMLVLAYFSALQSSSKNESSNAIATPSPTAIDPRSYQRPPLGHVIYSPNGRYAADIAYSSLYIFDTQNNQYLQANNTIDNINGNFVFNNDSTLIAAYSCTYGTHYCFNYSLSIFQLFEDHYETLQYFSQDLFLLERSNLGLVYLAELPLESIRSLRFVNIYGQELLYLDGCVERGFSSGMVFSCSYKELYWNINHRLWLTLPNE